MKTKSRITSLIFALVIATVGWIYLFSQDWKIAIAIMLVVWANNITNKHNK